MLVPHFFLEDHFTKYESIIEKRCTCHKKIRKGAILHDAQAEDKTSYYIQDGIAALTMTNEVGNERLLFFLCRGSIYPINTLKMPLSMDGYLQLSAITDLNVLAFPAQNILKMTAESNEMVSATIDHYVKYTNVLLCKLLLDSYNDSTVCICSFLYLYKTYYKSNNIINLNQEQIGQLLGLSRMQVARVLSTLRQEGIIETSRNKILVLDTEKLKINCSDIVID